MRRGLNLQALRSGAFQGPAPEALRPAAEIAEIEDGSLRVNRREFLLLSGALGVGAAPVLRSLSSSFGRFQLVGDHRRLAFVLDGVERWVIDSRRFAGRPRIRLDRDRRRLTVRLTGARLPGTRLGADLVARVSAGLLHSWLRLAFPRLGWSFHVPFEPWLLDEAPARAWHEGTRLCHWAGVLLRLHSGSEVEFDRGWRFRLHGGVVSSLAGLGPEWPSGSLAISLDEPGEASLLDRPGARRTRFTLERGSHPWPFEAEIPCPAGARLEPAPSPFERVLLEAGESRRGRVAAALVASGSEERASFTFYPGGRLADSAGGAAAVPLHRARYARSLAADGESALLASLPGRPLALHADGFDLRVDDPADRPAFEAVSGGGRPARLDLVPDVSAVGIPIQGAVVATSRLPGHTRFPFTWSDLACSLPCGIRIDPSGGLECRLPPLRVSLLRPRDLLLLELELINLELRVVDGRPCLVPSPRPPLPGCREREPGDEPYLVVHFPPQGIGEEAFWHRQADIPDSEGGEEPPPAPLPPERTAGSRLAGPSRLAFRVPAAVEGIPFTLEALLDWSRLEPSVVAGAVGPGAMASYRTAPIEPPAAYRTAIEAPYRLVLSPHAASRWDHAVAAAASAPIARTELWHTRLGVAGSACSEGEAEPRRTVRAIWSPDYVADPRSPELPRHYDATLAPGDLNRLPFRSSLDRRDRYEIVRLTSDFGLVRACTPADTRPYLPEPVAARQLMLSALGAWLDLEGAWSLDGLVSDPPFSVEEWRHRAAMGRDNFVRVVYAGYLFPFGHRAALIKETERRTARPGERNAAFLRQRMYIVVRQPEKTYPAPEQPRSGREFPFRRVVIRTRRTPDLDRPEDGAVDGLSTEAFWPMVAGTPFHFQVTADDLERPARPIQLAMPLVFVDRVVVAVLVTDPGDDRLSRVVTSYNGSGSELRARVPAGGAKVAFAPPTRPGDTSLEVDNLRFAATMADPADAQRLLCRGQPPFYPAVASAMASLSSAAAFTGTEARSEVVFHSTYLDSGFGGAGGQAANRGEVFVKLVDSPPLAFPGERSGGLATPSIDIGALSRLAGPVAGNLDEFAAGRFDPVQFFRNKFNPTVLGIFKLGDILRPVAELQGNIDKVPRLLGEELNVLGDLAEAAQGVADELKRFLARLDELERDASLGSFFAEPLPGLPPVPGSLAELETRVEEALGAFDVPSSFLAALNDLARTSALATRLTSARDEYAAILARQTTASFSQADLDRLEDALAFDFDAALTGLRDQVRGTLGSLRPLGKHPTRALRRQLEADLARAAGDVTALAGAVPGIVGALRDLAEALGRQAQDLGQGQVFLIAQALQAVEKVRELARLVNVRDAVKAELERKATSVLLPRIQAALMPFAGTQLGSELAVVLSAGLASEVNALADQVRDLLAARVSALAAIDALVGSLASLGPALAAAYARGLEAYQVVEGVVSQLTRPREIKVSYDFRPEVKDWPESAPIFKTTPATSLTLRATIRKAVDPANLAGTDLAFHYEVDAALRDFSLVLIPSFACLKVNFEALRVFVRDGATGVDVALAPDGVELGEDLGFVKALQEYLPFNRDSGPTLGVSTSGIRIGYRQAFPAIAVGAFSFLDVSLSAGIELSFTGAPAVLRFAFCERERPFALTYGIFSGGGFFAVALNFDRLIEVEGALEFGARAVIDLAGIARGEVHALGGIYFRRDQRGAHLTGYSRTGGELSVLGIVSVSVEFYMGLTYDGSDSAVGSCQLKIEIELLFFSYDVTLRVERRFQGGIARGLATSPLRYASLDPAAAFRALAAGAPCFEDDYEEWRRGDLRDPEVWRRYRSLFAW